MRLCVIRGPHLNASDVGNYMGAVEHGIELTFAGANVPMAEMKDLYPVAEFVDYGGDLMGIIDREFDALDIPDLFYPFSRMLAMRHKRVIHVAWDNNPGRNSGLHEFGEVWKHTARSTMARQTLLYDGVDSKRVKTIYGAVDTEFFHPKPWQDRANAVLFAGRNVSEKGLIHAIWAMSGLPAELWVTSEWLVGDQEKHAHRANVKLVGRQDRMAMRKMLQTVRAVVFPSMPRVGDRPDDRWTEQFGQLLIEAMASGTPVVAYDSGAIKEVLGDEIIQCHACGDWTILGAALHQLTSDQEGMWNMYSDYNRARAERMFAQEVIGGQIADWYTDDFSG